MNTISAIFFSLLLGACTKTTWASFQEESVGDKRSRYQAGLDEEPPEFEAMAERVRADDDFFGAMIAIIPVDSLSTALFYDESEFPSSPDSESSRDSDSESSPDPISDSAGSTDLDSDNFSPNSSLDCGSDSSPDLNPDFNSQNDSISDSSSSSGSDSSSESDYGSDDNSGAESSSDSDAYLSR